MATIEEKELEDYFDEEPLRLADLGIIFAEYSNFYRQFRLGSFGVADIVVVTPTPGFSDDFLVEIVELKKGVVDVNALMQAARYIKGFRSHFGHFWKGRAVTFDFRVTLIGGSVSETDWVYLSGIIPNLQVYTYSLDLSDGIQFSEARIRDYSPIGGHLHDGFQQEIAEWRANFNNSLRAYRQISTQPPEDIKVEIPEVVDANYIPRRLPRPPEVEKSDG